MKLVVQVAETDRPPPADRRGDRQPLGVEPRAGAVKILCLDRHVGGRPAACEHADAAFGPFILILDRRSSREERLVLI